MPRTRSLAWSQLKVGTLALAALALASVFIYLIGGQGGFFWQQYTLKTRFPDVQGLQSGAAVRVAGVSVGTVRAIAFAGSEVEVELKVSRSMQDKITTDSRAFIGSLSLLGAAVVDITPMSTGEPIPDGGYIVSRRPYGQLADVADGATRSLSEATALLADLRQGKGTVGRLFADDQLYVELTAFVASAETIAAALAEGKGTLGKLINDPAVHTDVEKALRNLADITSRISAGEGTIGRLLADDTLAASAGNTMANLDEVTGRLAKGEGTLGKLSTDEALYQRLDTLSVRLDQLVERLNAGEGTAGQLLRDRQLYENMNGAVGELRALVGDIRKDPKKYLNVRVSIF